MYKKEFKGKNNIKEEKNEKVFISNNNGTFTSWL